MVYALIDKQGVLSRGLTIEEIAKKIEKLKIPIAQYRNKLGSLSEQIDDLLLIKKEYSGELIINDKIELIEYVDGLHLGQEDIRKYDEDLSLAVERVRVTIGSRVLGLSTHNREEILEANGLDLNYIGLGAYRGTQTKSDAKVLGQEAIALARLSSHPVGLIGGVKLSDRFPKEITYRVIGSDLYED